MKLTKAEKETILRFSEDSEEQMTLFTYSRPLKDQLLKAGATLKRECLSGSWTLEMPKEWFKRPRPKRALSAAQKLVMSERLRVKG